MIEVTADSAAAYSGGYLLPRVISSCINLPEPAASASAEPDMLANTRLCSTLTCASPPGQRPTIALQKRSSLSMMLPVLMKVAARMNSGIANSR